MKNIICLQLLRAVLMIGIFSGFSACKKIYVVQPQDIQAFLDDNKELDIKLPSGSYFELIDMNGNKVEPCYDSTSTSGGKKYRLNESGVFGLSAYGQGPKQPGYRCPPVCEIRITPQR